MPVHYTQTLGQDRLYQAYYLFSQYPQEKLIINIDSGTFTTIDMISAEGFLGGYIIPGLELLNETYMKGHHLSKVTYPTNLDQLSDLPHSTEEAMSLGLFKIYEGLFHLLYSHMPTMISLTGGKSDIIIELIKHCFAEVQIKHQPHLIHQALTLIYQRVQV